MVDAFCAFDAADYLSTFDDVAAYLEAVIAEGDDDPAQITQALGDESSPIVTYILDTTKPKVTISAPVDKATIDGTSVTIVGKTQGRSSITARNEANGHTAIGVADGKGSFQVAVPLADGTNAISVTATDPAGNATTAVVTSVSVARRRRVTRESSRSSTRNATPSTRCSITTKSLCVLVFRCIASPPTSRSSSSPRSPWTGTGRSR